MRLGERKPEASSPKLRERRRLDLAPRAHVISLPYGPEDLEPSAAPALVSTAVPEDEFVDVVSDAGCAAVGLPRTYPVHDGGVPVSHELCRPVGQAAWDAGLPGIACRSAAPAAPPGGEELARFGRGEPLTPLQVRRFLDWF